MNNSELVSIIASLGLTVFMLCQRQVVFSWSMIGVYFTCSLIFVSFGVLILPWFLQETQILFPSYDISKLRSADLNRAVILSVGGMTLVTLFYQLTHVVATGSYVRRAPNLLAPVWPIKLGLSIQHLVLFSGISALATIAYFVVNYSVFVNGFIEGILAAEPPRVIEARQQAIRHYFYALAVYNVLPFFGVCLWMASSLRRDRWLRWYAIGYNLWTMFALLAVFQKRPLIVYLVALFVADSWIRRSTVMRRATSVWPARRKTRRLRYRVRAIGYGAILLTLLMGLYFTQTTIGREGESLTATLHGLATRATSRIFGRLSLPAAEYAHFYPRIDPHYGLTNIGLISPLLQTGLYRDTYEVSSYFTGRAVGTVAVSALVDYYGAYGLVGWVFGSLCLGVMLERIDNVLVRLRPTAGNILLVVFMFVFSYYLSQASVPRSLMGYGGGTFFALWLLIRTPPDLMPRNTSQSTPLRSS